MVFTPRPAVAHRCRQGGISACCWVGYFEGLDNGCGIEWRCADGLSLREFLLLSSRSRLPLEVHEPVFAWTTSAVLGVLPGFRAASRSKTVDIGFSGTLCRRQKADRLTARKSFDPGDVQLEYRRGGLRSGCCGALCTTGSHVE